MLIRRQDLSVLLLYYLGYSRIRNLFLRFQHKPVTRIAMFHDILPEELECFKANLYFLQRSTNVVSFDDFFSNKLSSDKINIIITFDDGYKSWVSDAVPVLKELGLPATFFISSGFVGLSKEDEPDFMQSKLFIKLGTERITTSGLNIEDVRKIVKEGFSIGGHTLNHCNLSELRDSVQLRYEIAEDKLRLERIAGKKIEYFAYPLGAYNNPEINVTEVLRQSGYKGAVTTAGGFNSAQSDPYLLHRELTSASTPGPVFRARVYGNYDPVRFLKKLLGMILRP